MENGRCFECFWSMMFSVIHVKWLLILYIAFVERFFTRAFSHELQHFDWTLFAFDGLI